MLGYAEAKKATDAIVAEAMKRKIPMSIAVVDDHGDMILFTRMDGAGLASITSAQNKAYTSIWVKNDTSDYKKSLAARGELGTIGDPRRTTVAGGVVLGKKTDPVTGWRTCLGAIGAGGGNEQEDEMFANIGRAALGL